MTVSGLSQGRIRNPFATRYVRPGAVEWIGSGEASLDSIRSRFDTLNRYASIVGPHGSGKTTLLHHLVPRLVDCWEFIAPDGQSARHRSAGPEKTKLHSVDRLAEATGVWIQLRRGQSHGWGRLRHWQRTARVQLIVLDGYEQLFLHQKLWLHFERVRRGFGMLVTSHRRPWLMPELFDTSVNANTALRVVQQVQDSVDWKTRLGGDRLETDLNQLLRQENGNLREVLMHCYDEFEQATQSGPS